MSRLSPLSPAALQARFSPDAGDSLIMLLTLDGPGIGAPIRLADGYTQRLSETADEVVYGVVSRSQSFMFLPMQITLPGEEDSAAPRFKITLHDVTRQLMPVIRSIPSAPTATLELVMMSTPDVVEASFPGFKLGSVNYNADSITADLSVESWAVEPFPAHTFSPAYFPGLF